MPQDGAKVIVFGNEKGGTGKSTLAMHVAVALLAQGRRVATIDLDAGQGTLSRYIANRREGARRRGRTLPIPDHAAISPAVYQDGAEAELAKTLAGFARHDVVVVDTPGHDSALSLAGHSYADIVVTPINDSLVDLDVIAEVDAEKRAIRRPSHYAERVWRAKQMRARRDGGSIDWLVVRNRVGALDARNKRLMARLLAELAKRMGCRIVDGIGERVIYRELFLDGLTVEDLPALAGQGRLALSHVAARAELGNLVHALNLPDADAAPAPAMESAGA
ncbi:MAG: division plane positioning ATPase MipZ [Rhodospirillaceae bacterium]|nr:division plane positioning ATPase MipZ [Rhodospirillaceae bacterium]